MEDREFFSSDSVYVSLTRFVVFGQTYAMSGVTSVRATRIGPNRFLPIIVVLIGVFFLRSGGNWIIFGLAMIGAAIWLWKLQTPEYVVLLSSASGEMRALRSEDLEYITDVVQALNDCIVARG